jgi:hypothetical protein
MWKVTVDKDELLKAVQKNRDKHNGIFLKALEKYREALIKDFESKVESLRKGKEISVYTRLPTPEDHTDDYDTVIGMLKMSTETTVELGTEEYANYVEDNWSWSRAFVTNTSSYVTK